MRLRRREQRLRRGDLVALPPEAASTSRSAPTASGCPASSSTATTSSPSTRRPARRSRAPARAAGRRCSSARSTATTATSRATSRPTAAPDEVEEIRARRATASTRFARRVVDRGLVERARACDAIDDEVARADRRRPSTRPRPAPTPSRGRPADRRLRQVLGGRWRATITFQQAINEALAQEMRARPDRRRLRRGRRRRRRRAGRGRRLGRRAGRHQGRSTPSSPGACSTPRSPSRRSSARRSGAACSGLRPVVELMFVDFMGVCFDQIFNQAAKFRYMFGGKAETPMVIRTMFGAGIRAAAQHSQSALPDLHPHPRAQGRRPVEPVRRQGPADRGDPRRRPGHLLREQGPLHDGGRRPRGALHDPVRRGQRRARGRRRHDRRDRPRGAAWRARPPRSSPATASSARSSTRARPRRSTRRRSSRACESTGRLVVVDEANPRCGIAADIVALVAQNVLRRSQGRAPDGHGAAHARCRSAPVARGPRTCPTPAGSRTPRAAREAVGGAQPPEHDAIDEARRCRSGASR